MKIVLTIILSLLPSSCPEKKEKMTNEVAKEDISFTSLYSGNLNGSGEIDSQNVVVSTKEDWQKLLSKFELTDDAVPAIDFSKSTLLVLVDQVRNTGGFSIKVDNIKEKEGQLLVTVKKTGPKPTDMVTMAITQPFEVVEISKTDKEVVFE